MQPTEQNPQPKQSHKPSITGFVLTLLSLPSSGIAYFLTHAQSRSHTEVTTPFGKTDSGPVADIASGAVTGIFSMPFIVVGILLALLALLFIILRLRKVKAVGLIFSFAMAAIAIWSIFISVDAFQVIKADPAN